MAAQDSKITYLYRILRPHDKPERGLYPTNRSADISIDDHINRGGYKGKFVSQYISTSREPKVLLQWLYREGLQRSHDPTLAIIDCRRLHDIVNRDDVSGGHPDLSDDSYIWATKHKEVLVHPYINKGAIIGYVRFSDLRGVAYNWSLFQDKGLRRISSIRADSARYNDMGQGYTGRRPIVSSHLARCSFCRECGHDDSDCHKLDDWMATEHAIERYDSLSCSFCRECGHDDSDCHKLDDWMATENAIERYYHTFHRF